MRIIRKIYNKLPSKIKKVIRKILHKDNNSKNNTITKEKLNKTLFKYDIISFDIFDTLITRTIYDPDDLFKIMNDKIKDIELKDTIYNMRKKAEEFARNTLHKDVDIDEIYNELGKIYNYDKEIVNKIKNLEIDLELSLTCPRKDMLDILRSLMDEKKEVILTSDMYLTKNIIIEMLKKCGFNEGVHYKKIYLSNEQNKRKDDGTMWKYLKEKYSNSKLIHIGDNINSDYLIPIKYGVKAIHIDNSRDQLKKTNYYYTGIAHFIEQRTNSDSIFLGYIINEQIFNSPFSSGVDSLEKISKVFTSPMILELIKFVDEKSKSNSKLLFLAREGYFLEKIYEEYCNIFNIKTKEHYYFLASRKAAMSTSINSKDDVKNSLNRNYIGNIKSFLKSVYDIDYTGDDYDIKLPDELEDVYNDIEKYEKEIIKKSAECKKNYIEYINSIVNYEKDNLVIVDLGYSGTIQFYLSKMLNKDLEGIYLTNSNSVKRYSKKSKLLFAYDINKNRIYEKIYHYSLILEYFLSAPYGQLQYFMKKNGTIVPIYNDEKMDSNKEKNTKEIYKYIIEFINRYKELNDIYKLNITKELLCSNYISLVESNIISKNVKDKFDFMDSFTTNETKNVFKIISRY